MSDPKDLIDAVDFATLPEAMVRSYIIEAIRAGQCRSAQYHAREQKYAITTNNYNEIQIRKVNGNVESWAITALDDAGNLRGNVFASGLRELNKAIRDAAKNCGDFWGDEPTMTRLNRGQYAGNVGRLAVLIGNRTVEAIFDPYLCNDSLLVFTDLASVGGFSISQDLRLLSLQKMTQGTTPRFTRTFVDGWFEERGVPGGKAKVMPEGHERFLLLSGTFALIVGCSLNKITHDESAHLVPDAELRRTFDAKWAAALDLR